MNHVPSRNGLYTDLILFHSYQENHAVPPAHSDKNIHLYQLIKLTGANATQLNCNL